MQFWGSRHFFCADLCGSLNFNSPPPTLLTTKLEMDHGSMKQPIWKDLKKKKKSECKMSAKPKLMQIRFPCLLGDAYSAVWLLSVIFQLLTVVELHYRAKREAGGWNSLSPLHLKLHLILSSCLTLFLAQPVAGTVLLLFRFYKRWKSKRTAFPTSRRLQVAALV